MTRIFKDTKIRYQALGFEFVFLIIGFNFFGLSSIHKAKLTPESGTFSISIPAPTIYVDNKARFRYLDSEWLHLIYYVAIC